MCCALTVIGPSLVFAQSPDALPSSTTAPPQKSTPAPAATVENAAVSTSPASSDAVAQEASAQVEPAQPIRQLRRVVVRGTLAKGDNEQRLLAFLDIATPGVWNDQIQGRVRRDLDVLGYLSELVLDEGGVLTITVRPMRVVRRMFVTGNWPIFEWEIFSYVTWRTGYRLPEGDELLTEIRKQERELCSFLQRTGYYDAKAQISLDWAPGSPEQVDVRIRINLGVGFWRLRYKIGTIKSEGFSLLSQSELYDFFDHCCLWLGRTSTERLNEDFKRLIDYYQAKGYAGVRLTHREIQPDKAKHAVNLDLTIEERKRIVLKFVGRKQVSEKDLRSVVTIFRDNYYSANELDESARNIYRLYQQQGYFESRVTWRWKSRTTDPLEVEFDIHEGSLLKVRDIEFAAMPGKSALNYSATKLNDHISTRRYPRLGLIGLGEGGFASAIQLDQDVRRLEEFYRREGYPKAKVVATVARSKEALENAVLLGLMTAYDDAAETGDLFVRFLIDEGPRESVETVEVQFVGAHSLTEAQVRKVLQLQAGKPYTNEAVLADRQRLSELFGSSGHPYADIDPTRSTWNADHTKVSLRWSLDEHETVRFGPILIRGNFVTREGVIRKDLPFKTGDLFDRNKLLEAQQNLLGRQIFSSVRVSPNPGETDDYRLEARLRSWKLSRNPVPILVEVVERYDSAGEIGVYVGVSTDNPIYSTGNYTWRNLFGTGAEVELRGELGVRVQSMLARLANPRLFSPFLRLDLRGFWRNENTYSVGQVTSYGANAELTRFVASTDDQGRRLPPTLRLFSRLEFNISQILVPLYRAEGSSEVQIDGDRTQSLKLSAGVVWDRRVGFEAPALRLRNLPVPPNPLMPVSGFLLSFQATTALCCSFAPLNVDGSFVSLASQAVLLKPFGPELRSEEGWPYGMRRFNLKLNLRINYGIPLRRSALPVVERYFAGGDSSTRGYDADALKAEEVRSPIGPLSGDVAYRIVPQGGSVRILSQIEWEFAITPKILSWPWVGALFLDTGAVFDGWEKLRWNDVRFSAGVSLLRLLTQFGALSLDYAYPLTMPGQDSLLQSDRWKREPWYQHFPGRIHFNWGMPISL
jgi:outer membrane protein assembly factor BamA